ncbi:hypothetical protein M3Y99_00994100 [Aphelenchoides fujianensis]|nr:hypothetical protein M3Y99_00994100 [Aphelenchoides fujianensis]
MHFNPQLSLLMALLSVCLNSLPTALAAKVNTVRVQVYFEPQDPESTRFFKSELLPLFQTGIGARIDLKLVPFGRASCDAGHQDYVCTCTRGADECELMHLMSCTLHDYRHHEDAVELIACIQGQPSFNEAYNQCIKQLPDREASWLLECPHVFRGKYLSWFNGLKTKAMGVELPAVPTVAIDGEIDGQAADSLRTRICERLEAPKPMECL